MPGRLAQQAGMVHSGNHSHSQPADPSPFTEISRVSDPAAPPRGAFYWLSQLVVATYGRFPVFGPVRSSIALIRRGNQWLTVTRADLRGVCFPGGVAVPWESNEACLYREVFEETGMRITGCRRLFDYFDKKFVPGFISVYAAEAEGELKSSWEGRPQWLALDEFAPRIFPSQHVVLGYLRACTGTEDDPSGLPEIPSLRIHR